MKHIHIIDEQVEDLLCYKWLDVAEAIESAFVDETADMIPKTYLDGWGGDFRAMPAALGDYAAVKWVSVFPDNWKKEKHTVSGTLVLSDRRTGETLATMDCRTLTAYRTAATSAIAAKYCAPDAREFAIIGCGIQGRYHVEAYEAICRSHMSLNISLYDHDERAQRIFFNWLALVIIGTMTPPAPESKASLQSLLEGFSRRTRGRVPPSSIALNKLGS